MKCNLRFLLLAMAIVAGFVAVPINDIWSQTLINKELMNSSNENGRVFQWVKQTYVVGRDTVCAAFNLNGKRITPNGFYSKKGRGVYYVGNGVFGVCLKKKDKHGNYIHTAYNTDGKCIISEMLAELSCFNDYYTPSESAGTGLFTAISYLDVTGKERVCALYNTKGECLISKDEGFDGFLFNDENGFKYLSGHDKEVNARAIYDVTGKPLIPKNEGFTYIAFREEGGLKYFLCKTKIDGKTVDEAVYDVTGKPLIPKNEGFTYIFFREEGGLKYFLCKTEIDGKSVNKAVYDMSFKKVFPDNYKWIAYYEQYGVWWCQSKYGDENYTYSKDLRYYAPGYYNNNDMNKFNSTKKANPNYDGPYNFSRVSNNTPSASYTSNNASGGSSSSSFTSSSTSNSDILFQGTYYTDGNGVDFQGNYYRGPAGTYNIVVYKDHIVVNGKYCEYAYSDAWARKTGRYKADGYSWNHTTNSHGLPHDEFFQVDEKTKTITLFCRDMHPSGIPVTCHLTLTQSTNGGSNVQFQSTYQQPQYQNQYQQQNTFQQPTYNSQPQQRQQKDCSTCNGTGKCRTCNGKGWYTEMGIGGGNHDCPNCNNGNCQWCNGTGKQK